MHHDSTESITSFRGIVVRMRDVDCLDNPVEGVLSTIIRSGLSADSRLNAARLLVITYKIIFVRTLPVMGCGMSRRRHGTGHPA